MPFAEISDAVWLAIIGVVTMVIKEIFDRQRGKAAVLAATTAASKAEEVKETLAHDTEKRTERQHQVDCLTATQNEKLDKVAAKVEEVHKLVDRAKPEGRP